MYRGTTPTHRFMTDVDLKNASVIFISYFQNGKSILEKNLRDIDIYEGMLEVRLSQEDTLKFKDGLVEIQIRVGFIDGSYLSSKIIRTSIDKILKEGVI